ncbi:LysR substrate-binding domain-containing protein [Labrys monachus]|uniref:LysR family glycine cleavage system transcriptional activator n=1 Tax=Labrys monachus TaxID=217067 RepID=A0ABU0FJU5_9HYPH|nr:LysR substrate-binding domain-containing protein [Labrys monachus]MDQ0394882.1 LysR family glycine cleavage system transcriptional activator [Labrys monachus]
MADLRNLPLPTLRTFEAAARHQSLSKAAAELNLTDSAVSHQLRRLEEALGYDLFGKAGRGVVLTEAGRAFAKTVAAALQEILAAAIRLSEADQVGGRLDIACPPMFASAWLAKHLKDFCRDHPTVECHIRLVENQRAAELGDADIAIAFGPGGWADRWSALLAHVEITPVCSPTLFQSIGRTIATPADLAHSILLHWDDGSEWRRWLSEAGSADVGQKARHLYCSDLGMAIDLAIDGAGVALVSDTLSSTDIRKGLLLRPFAFSIDAFGGWHVLCSHAGLGRASARQFLRWLLAAFGRDDAWASIPDLHHPRGPAS